MPLAATYTLSILAILLSLAAYRIGRKGAPDPHQAGGKLGIGAGRRETSDIAHRENGLSV